MSLFEVLFKRRRFLPLHQRLWQEISPHLLITVAAEDDPAAHRRECFFYAAVVHASVYVAALEAGMSTSTGYSLARIQLRKCPFDDELLERVDALFSAEHGSAAQLFAERLLETVGSIAGGLHPAQLASPVDTAEAMAGLQAYFSGLGSLEGPVPEAE